MKEVKTFIIVEVILAVLKALAGWLCNSYAMLASCLFEIVLIICSLFVLKNKDNKKYKGIITSFVGIIIVLLGFGIIFISMINKVMNVSWLIILFLIVGMLLRYIVGCIYSNISYQKRGGLLGYANINSNMDFYMTGIVLATLILSKLSKLVEAFKYADRIGTVIIALFIVWKGIKVIRNSFHQMEESEAIYISYEKEINDRSEVKKIVSIKASEFGGLTKLRCNLILNNNLTMLDLNTFVVSLQDYLLKIADVVEVKLQEELIVKKPKVRSLKQDARNSGSGNSKANTKKKNTKKKNKKR